MKIIREEFIGPHHLIQADCRDVLEMFGPASFDVVLTDPPYGEEATHAQHLSSITLKNGEPARQALGFEGITADELVAHTRSWVGLAKRWVVFTCEWKHAHRLEEGGMLVRFGIWRKPDGAPQFTGDRPGMGWEAVAICHRSGKKRWNGGGKHGFWSIPKGTGRSGHPTEKPEALFSSWVMDFSEPGEVVLDPFMGSGTSGVSCAKLGREFVGIERQTKFFDIACRRIEEVVKQPDMFITEARSEPEQVGFAL